MPRPSDSQVLAYSCNSPLHSRHATGPRADKGKKQYGRNQFLATLTYISLGFGVGPEDKVRDGQVLYLPAKNQRMRTEAKKEYQGLLCVLYLSKARGNSRQLCMAVLATSWIGRRPHSGGTQKKSFRCPEATLQATAAKIRWQPILEE